MTPVYSLEVLVLFLSIFSGLLVWGCYARKQIAVAVSVTGFIGIFIAHLATLTSGYENGVVILPTLAVGAFCIYLQEKGICFSYS